MRPLILALLLSLPLAGCLSGSDDATVQAPDDPVAARIAEVPLDIDIAAEVDLWETFSREFQKRDAYLPANDAAQAFLIGQLEQHGFDVEVRTYAGCVRGACAPGPLGEEVTMTAIVATQPGTLADDEGRERRIGLVSHFDTTTTTIEGAYDDASGVMAELAVCKALAGAPLRHALSCIFFDAEEQGLEASRAYVEDAVVEGDEDFVYDYVIGYDMTGINWPGHDWRLYLMTGDAEHVPALAPFARQVMHGTMGYPEHGVEVLDVHDRNSDERRFRDAGVPIYRFAGGRHAADYPEYHRPGDTVEYVYGFAGGRAAFEAGFGTVVEASHALVLGLDGTRVDTLA